MIRATVLQHRGVLTLISSDGGIGRHARLKILWAIARSGSSPDSSTKDDTKRRMVIVERRDAKVHTKERYSILIVLM